MLALVHILKFCREREGRKGDANAAKFPKFLLLDVQKVVIFLFGWFF